MSLERDKVTTTYVMDLNAGLPQVLDDGTNTYLYGNARLAQINTGTQYFLDDALGSVRQMTDPSGDVTLARAYDPYGVTRDTAHVGSDTSYGFTGEFTENTGMIYLRARHYSPSLGRFMTRDTWNGDANMPMSYNRWNYTNSNPINRVDPSGHCFYFWGIFLLWRYEEPMWGFCANSSTPTSPSIPSSTPTCTPTPNPTVELWIYDEKWRTDKNPITKRITINF